jgi:hypothetical protein
MGDAVGEGIGRAGPGVPIGVDDGVETWASWAFAALSLMLYEKVSPL